MDDGGAYVDIFFLVLDRRHLNNVWLGILGAFTIFVRRLDYLGIRLGGNLRLLATFVLVVRPCIACEQWRGVSSCIELDTPACIGSNSGRVFDTLPLDRRLGVVVVQIAIVATLFREDAALG